VAWLSATALRLRTPAGFESIFPAGARLQPAPGRFSSEASRRRRLRWYITAPPASTIAATTKAAIHPAVRLPLSVEFAAGLDVGAVVATPAGAFVVNMADAAGVMSAVVAAGV